MRVQVSSSLWVGVVVSKKMFVPLIWNRISISVVEINRGTAISKKFRTNYTG
jgi:hypothetical protein